MKVLTMRSLLNPTIQPIRSVDLLQNSQIHGTSRLELGSIDDLRISKKLKARRLYSNVWCTTRD
ncbi:hypothetical protein [Nostoc sp.]|uniref:hypothetical protein n=1 Tax=Nostoc sp. TaxID=1180 RepID=UPI002FF726F0